MNQITTNLRGFEVYIYMYVPHIVKISVRVSEGVAQAHREDFISPPGNVSALHWRSLV